MTTRYPPEGAWRAASIAALEAERRKNDEEAARLNYERMERETWERARRVYDLTEEINDETAALLISTLSDWAAESADPITLRLMQPGGSIISGLAVYDFVLGLRSEITVDTLALGWAASMGSVLLQCGETRRMAPNSFLLIHESRTRYTEEFLGYIEKLTDQEDSLRFSKMLEERIDRILAERSVLTVPELRRRYIRRDWWLTAQDAVDLGFADELWSP